MALVDAADARGTDGAGVLLGAPDAGGGGDAGGSNSNTCAKYCGVCCCWPWLSVNDHLRPGRTPVIGQTIAPSAVHGGVRR